MNIDKIPKCVQFKANFLPVQLHKQLCVANELPILLTSLNVTRLVFCDVLTVYLMKYFVLKPLYLFKIRR